MDRWIECLQFVQKKPSICAHDVPALVRRWEGVLYWCLSESNNPPPFFFSRANDDWSSSDGDGEGQPPGEHACDRLRAQELIDGGVQVAHVLDEQLNVLLAIRKAHVVERPQMSFKEGRLLVDRLATIIIIISDDHNGLLLIGQQQQRREVSMTCVTQNSNRVDWGGGHNVALTFWSTASLEVSSSSSHGSSSLSSSSLSLSSSLSSSSSSLSSSNSISWLKGCSQAAPSSVLTTTIQGVTLLLSTTATPFSSTSDSSSSSLDSSFLLRFLSSWNSDISLKILNTDEDSAATGTTGSGWSIS